MKIAGLLGIMVIVMAGCTYPFEYGQSSRVESIAVNQGVVLDIDPEGIAGEDAITEARRIIQARIEGLGAGGIVETLGSQCILVGVSDDVELERVLAMIERPGLLEFVDIKGAGLPIDSFTGQQIQTTESVARNLSRPDAILDGFLFYTVMTGSMLRNVQAQYFQNSAQWVISFELTPEGSDIFGAYTESHIGEPLAIVLDGVVLSAPTIQSRLDSGGIISGNFTEDEAQQLGIQIQSGALTAPMNVLASATLDGDLAPLRDEYAAECE
jgi:preprotein translocase subunit SecD